VVALLALSCVIAVATANVVFKETFDAGWDSRWVMSKFKESDGTQGQWRLAAGEFHGDSTASQGIQTSEDARFYGISAAFTKPVSNQGVPLVLQFTVKFDQAIDCGGAYAKILFAGFDQAQFGGDTPYAIMFGPDICGSTRRIHLIFSYKGQNYLWKKQSRPETDRFTHLYTLHLFPDNTYEVLVDGESRDKGSLHDDWDLLAAREIDDTSAKKPGDWDDHEFIEDPEDKKPATWDQPEFIRDDKASKPADWDPENDGEWEAPMVPNPAYKGEWRARKIKNPAFKGIWKAPKVPNPEFVDDPLLYRYENMGGLGVEIWQVKSGTIFDNFFVSVGDNAVTEAKDFAANTSGKFKEQERAMEQQQQEARRKAAAAAAPPADESGDEEGGSGGADEEDDHEYL